MFPSFQPSTSSPFFGTPTFSSGTIPVAADALVVSGRAGFLVCFNVRGGGSTGSSTSQLEIDGVLMPNFVTSTTVAGAEDQQTYNIMFPFKTGFRVIGVSNGGGQTYRVSYFLY